MSNYKPEKYQDVIPYMLVDGAAAFIDFVKAAFGAEELERHENEDGKIMHGAVRIGDSIVELSDGGGPYTPRPCALHIYVPDTDAAFAKAIAAGATELFPVEVKPYGERSGGVTDPFGNQWYIATRTD